MNRDLSRWGVTSSGKCSGCNTHTGINRFGTFEYVYYCYTDNKGNKWPSCEKCLDRVKKMLEDDGLL